MAMTRGRDGSKSYLSLFIITANNPFNPKQLRSAIAVSVFVSGKWIYKLRSSSLEVNISSSLDVAKKYNNAQELVCANLLLIKSDHTV